WPAPASRVRSTSGPTIEPARRSRGRIGSSVCSAKPTPPNWRTSSAAFVAWRGPKPLDRLALKAATRLGLLEAAKPGPNAAVRLGVLAVARLGLAAAAKLAPNAVTRLGLLVVTRLGLSAAAKLGPN